MAEKTKKKAGKKAPAKKTPKKPSVKKTSTKKTPAKKPKTVKTARKTSAAKPAPEKKRRPLALTPREASVMRWSGRAVKQPWFDICDRWQRMYKGEHLKLGEALFDAFFLPFRLDARPLYHIMKTIGTKLVFGDNASLFTIVLNANADRIIWAGLEREEGGVYIEYFILNERLGGEWDEKAVKLLNESRLEEAFDHLSTWIRTQPDLGHIDLGAIKVANIQFFEAFKDAWEDADDGRKLALFGANAVEAVEEILQRGWIRFYPEVNLAKMLDAIHPVLRFAMPVTRLSQTVLGLAPF